MSENKYDLKPSKEAYQAVKSDVTPVSAFKELIDNALDNWRRNLDGLDPATIEIEYHEGGARDNDEIVIRDDTGGVEEDDLHILFALGQSNKGEISGSIGAYGVGAKKAIVNLGNQATIKSRHMYADTGFGFTIDQDWLEDESDWTVDKVTYEDIEEGVTEIRISDLNTPWGKYRENLVEELGKTYEHFLRDDKMEDMESVSIIVQEYDENDELTDTTEVEPPEPIEWSFTPMDDLFVRRYENIDLNSKEFDAAVNLNITVGLMREASAEDSGADIYCQHRRVLTGVTDERAGFGSDLGNFSGQHRRLRIIIEFETEGDARILPWDAQKSDIDPYNRVSRAALDWVRRMVEPYYRAAGAYDDLSTAMTRPYDRDCEHSITSGLDDPYDYEGRERVTHKPDSSLSEAIVTGDRADATAALPEYSSGDLEDYLEPAYREEFTRLVRDMYDFETEDEEETLIDLVPEGEVPEDLTESEAEVVTEDLRDQAIEHASRDPAERMVGLADWKQRLYDWHLEFALLDQGKDVDLEDLDTFEAEPEEVTETPSEEPETEDTETPETDTTDDQDTEQVEFEAEASETSESATDSGSDLTEETEFESGEDGLGSTEGLGSTSDGSTESVSTTDVAERTLDLTEDEWEKVVDALGLDDDASPEKVREELLEKLDLVRSLRA